METYTRSINIILQVLADRLVGANISRQMNSTLIITNEERIWGNIQDRIHVFPMAGQ